MNPRRVSKGGAADEYAMMASRVCFFLPNFLEILV